MGQIDDLLAVGRPAVHHQFGGAEPPREGAQVGFEVGRTGGQAREAAAVVGAGELGEQPPGGGFLGLGDMVAEDVFGVADQRPGHAAQGVVGGVGEHRPAAPFPQPGQGELDQGHPSGLFRGVGGYPLGQPRLEPQPGDGVDRAR